MILRRRISAASLGVPRRTWCPARPCPLADLAAMRIAQIEIKSGCRCAWPASRSRRYSARLPGPPRCRSGAGRARWQGLTAQFWLFPLELHPRGLPLRSEFLNIWYPFHAMVSLATGCSSATLPLAPRSRLFQLIDRLFWWRTIFPRDPPADPLLGMHSHASTWIKSSNVIERTQPLKSLA